MQNAPIMHTIALINTPFTPISLPRVTKNGALILPRFDIASEIPVPVDLIEVGKLSVVIRENRVKAKVLQILLRPTRTS
jgi:hypothetical protein